MAGVTQKGPHEGPPVPVTSFAEYQRIFGGYLKKDIWKDSCYLPYAIKGFFDNGGQMVYIKRVVPGGNNSLRYNDKYSAFECPGRIPLPSDYIGKDLGPNKKTGIKALSDIEDISIVAVPGITDPDVQKALIKHCEEFNRFAVLDGKTNELNPKIGEVISFKNDDLKYSSSFAAMYYPWLKVLDPVTLTNINVPPSGHVAGIIAKTDITRGVHKPPDNEVVTGIADVQFKLNETEAATLNKNRINTIRSFPGRGVLVFGSRTASFYDNELMYINVRRLLIFIEKSIYKSTQWVVFEPNNEKLWARVEMAITEFLTRVWRDGAFTGIKAEQTFYVKCDRSVMTQNDIDNGKVIVEIGVAPVKPAEFMVIRITQDGGVGES